MAYSTIPKPSLYFNTKLYSGNGTAIGSGGQAITGVGFQPDFTWIKERSSTSPHKLLDAVRGVTKELESNLTNAESTQAESLASFDSDGFTVGSNGAVNENSQTYASWNWKANGQGSSNTDGSINTTYTSVNSTAGFSISKYTGTGANATVGHGLGAVPKMIIFKELGGTNGWHVYHEFLGNNKVTLLDNVTQGYYNPNSFLNTTDPTSSLIYLGDSAGSNSTNGMIAYCFAEKTGYSKISSYTGNGNADGTFVYTGFKPAWVLIRRTDTGGEEWQLLDNKRNTFNPTNTALFPSDNAVENSGNDRSDFLSNGFKCRSTSAGVNASGGSYIYLAFAEEPLVANSGTGVPATAR